MPVKEKNLSIETTRGIAIILVVIGHVIGYTSTGGMQIDYPHPLRYVYLWIDYIQMPLFTAIAGWVYAYSSQFHKDCFTIFFKKKFMRLWVPMAVVGTLYFSIRFLIPGTNGKNDFSELWRIYVFPYTFYWYLPSLFIIFIIQWIIDKFKWMQTFKQAAGLIILSLIMEIITRHCTDAIPNLFSFKGALLQLPFFFTGMVTCRFFDTLKKNVLLDRMSWIMLFVGIGLINFAWFNVSTLEIIRGLYPFTLIVVLYKILSLKWKNKFFIWIGSFAYSIYLFHGFGTSGGRIILKALGIHATLTIFLTATLMAILLPIIIDKVASRMPILRQILLGKK